MSLAAEIKPELHEFYGDSSVVPEVLELGGGEVIPPTVEEVRHVVPIGVGLSKSDLLATVLGGVVTRGVCDFLTTLAATYPGFAVD
jgi:hypothetical protein